jgi:hypothetical protein
MRVSRRRYRGRGRCTVVVENAEELACNMSDKTYHSKNSLRKHIQSCHSITREHI